MSSPPRLFQIVIVIDRAMAISSSDPDITRWNNHSENFESRSEGFKKGLEEIRYRKQLEELASKVEHLREFAELESELLPRRGNRPFGFGLFPSS